jgi:hypothetical protein
MCKRSHALPQGCRESFQVLELPECLTAGEGDVTCHLRAATSPPLPCPTPYSFRISQSLVFHKNCQSKSKDRKRGDILLEAVSSTLMEHLALLTKQTSKQMKCLKTTALVLPEILRNSTYIYNTASAMQSWREGQILLFNSFPYFICS